MYLCTGYIDLGVDAMSPVLQSLGLRFPRRSWRIALAVLHDSLVISFLRRRFRVRDEATIDKTELARTDACYTLGLGMLNMAEASRSTAHVLRIALMLCGRLKELGEVAPEHARRGRDRADLVASTSARIYSAIATLSADQPERALDELSAAYASWNEGDHWRRWRRTAGVWPNGAHALFVQTWAFVYRGDGFLAFENMCRQWGDLRRQRYLVVPSWRALYYWVRSTKPTSSRVPPRSRARLFKDAGNMCRTGSMMQQRIRLSGRSTTRTPNRVIPGSPRALGRTSMGSNFRRPRRHCSSIDTAGAGAIRRLLFLSFWFMSSCTAGNEDPTAAAVHEPKIIARGGGPRIYWNSDVRRLDADSNRLRFAAVVVGLTKVELIEEQATGFSAREILPPPGLVPSPQCQLPFPTTIEASDIDADGDDDVIVLDNCLGNWIGVSTGDHTAGVAWPENFPHVPPSDYLKEVRIRGSGDSLLIATVQNQSTALLRGSGEGQWQEFGRLVIPTPTPLRITEPFVHLPMLANGSLVFQGYQQLFAFETMSGANSAAIGERTWKLDQVVREPYVAAFSAFDHLTSIDNSECGPMAIGVGTFGDDANIRLLELIRFEDTRYYVADFDSKLRVVTFGVVPRVDLGDALIMSLGSRETGRVVASLWRISSCDEPALLAEEEVEFDFRTADAPSDYTEKRLAKSDGAKLITTWDDRAGVLTSIHYDGYTVRRYQAVAAGESWMINDDLFPLHSDRDDVIFQERP